MNSISTLTIRRLVLLLTLTLPHLVATAQAAKEPSFIYWHERSRLTWDDFKGREIANDPVGKPGIAARTRVGIFRERHAYKDSPGTLTIAIKAAFNTRVSSVRADAKVDRLLAHEQLHFDMLELTVRKMRRAYTLANFNNPAERRKLPVLLKSLQKEYKDQQFLYNKEAYSSHEKQLEWNAQIAKELLALDEYRHPEVKLPFR